MSSTKTKLSEDSFPDDSLFDTTKVVTKEQSAAVPTTPSRDDPLPAKW